MSENQTFPLDLDGVLSGTQTYAVLLQAEIEPFPPLKLAFAWINKPSTEVRVLLEQINFFQEYDIHFYGHQKAFEIALKTGWFGQKHNGDFSVDLPLGFWLYCTWNWVALSGLSQSGEGFNPQREPDLLSTA